MCYYVFFYILILNNDEISALRSQRVVIRCKATSCKAQRKWAARHNQLLAFTDLWSRYGFEKQGCGRYVRTRLSFWKMESKSQTSVVTLQRKFCNVIYHSVKSVTSTFEFPARKLSNTKKSFRRFFYFQKIRMLRK
jgi:hypothetical protein